MTRRMPDGQTTSNDCCPMAWLCSLPEMTDGGRLTGNGKAVPLEFGPALDTRPSGALFLSFSRYPGLLTSAHERLLLAVHHSIEHLLEPLEAQVETAEHPA